MVHIMVEHIAGAYRAIGDHGIGGDDRRPVSWQGTGSWDMVVRVHHHPADAHTHGEYGVALAVVHTGDTGHGG